MFANSTGTKNMLLPTRHDRVSDFLGRAAWRPACTLADEHYGGRNMTRVWTGATFAIALGCAATLAAQQTTSSSSQTSQAAGSSSSRTITVTGCLERESSTGATGTTGTAGATSNAASGTQWMLMDATMGSGTGSSGATTSSGAAGTTAGAAGAAGDSSSGTSYILEPSAAADLSAHNGHKIEVTGTLAPSSSSSGGAGATAGAGAAGAAGGASSARAASQRIQVTSVKMVSASCK
jgi:hypothetical protein